MTEFLKIPGPQGADVPKVIITEGGLRLKRSPLEMRRNWVSGVLVGAVPEPTPEFEGPPADKIEGNKFRLGAANLDDAIAFSEKPDEIHLNFLKEPNVENRTDIHTTVSVNADVTPPERPVEAMPMWQKAALGIGGVIIAGGVAWWAGREAGWW